MQAGELRDRVGFYKRLPQGDGAGNTEAGYAATADFVVSGRIEPRLGGETVLAGRLTGTNLVNITVRQSIQMKTIDTAWKAHDERRGIDYNIRSIIDPNQGTAQRGALLEILCERGAAA
jgi:head-tail adaptor